MKEITRLTRCERGHFFDGGKYEECPHCNNHKTPEVTIYAGEDKSKKDSVVQNAPLEDIYSDSNPIESSEAIANAKADEVAEHTVFIAKELERPAPPSFTSETNNLTVHYYQKSIGTEPVVGWLVCIKGVHFGEDFKIKGGRNFIGRSGDMDISLSGDPAVSRDRHAILTYDPKSNAFMIQPGESSELCYLNDEMVLIPSKLKLNDRISIGACELVFIPFCSESFAWGSN